MKIGVFGLQHLGTVTAACLAKLGHQVIGVDVDRAAVANLGKGTAPVAETGLEELIRHGLSSGGLLFSSDIGDLNRTDLVWICGDTPLRDDGAADPESVIAHIERVMLGTASPLNLLISSQLPVGTVSRLEQFAAAHCAGREVTIAYSPENLRLGNALEDFLHPSRVIVGIRPDADKRLLSKLLNPITDSIEWMAVESAEMTKHAINAFFATSIAFANEIAGICESVGADAKDVERGLKTEPRIGVRAYLAPGGAFGGGTLARDVAYLADVARVHRLPAGLLASVLPSNENQKRWARRTLQSLFRDLSRATVAVWGLAYKPGTDSLQRSTAVDLCDWLLHEGATIRVHDPMVRNMPDRWRGVTRCDDPLTAIGGAHALIVATGWPQYRSFSAEQLAACTDGLAILDANRELSALALSSRLRYFSVGMPRKEIST
jgi:UDPglucose 6-dehydrogenase